jgi:hypothetical protein
VANAEILRDVSMTLARLELDKMCIEKDDQTPVHPRIVLNLRAASSGDRLATHSMLVGLLLEAQNRLGIYLSCNQGHRWLCEIVVRSLTKLPLLMLPELVALSSFAQDDRKNWSRTLSCLQLLRRLSLANISEMDHGFSSGRHTQILH